ncbi:conserved protein, unknown function [Babesia microti strain RI]|uniref:Rab5-interacting protein n=1 Tax=Babesia microti (strain RI) TaxID=1133968 RepID=A0A1N6LXM8_BABMR|nr:conserved protein, unknown function [Babesia microti strain RI]SIO73623.1 conserved protein, unknown function [Babesia microti strain RI]|eukprot:XP_021337704.1 conserved protein, unknown function [Babesia microti strain RI]
MVKESGQKNFINPNYPLTKERAFSIVWQLKQSVAAVLGFILGVIPLRSYLGFLLYILAQFAVVELYVIVYKVPDYVLDLREIIFEASIASCGCFVLWWVVTYSVVHF